MDAILVPIAMFAMILGIVWVVTSARSRSRENIQKTIQAAISNHTELTPETIQALGARAAKPYADLRAGVILVAVALGFIGLGLGVSTVDDVEVNIVAIMAGVGAFPGLVGLALIGMHLFLKKRDDISQDG